MKKKLVVLTGAGISAESGISTFRDANGLWEGHDVMDVASPEGFLRNPDLVLQFYNERRRQLVAAAPNAAHYDLAKLESQFDVFIITQNVDNLHERAKSSKVLHLHGELLKARSSKNHNHIVDWPGDLTREHTDPQGHPMRPHIVWFGEQVPALDEAVAICASADLLAVIGTSLQVYPAAGLVSFIKPDVPVFYIDPNPAPISPSPEHLEVIPLKATLGLPLLIEKLQAFL